MLAKAVTVTPKDFIMISLYEVLPESFLKKGAILVRTSSFRGRTKYKPGLGGGRFEQQIYRSADC